jgi:hypothetical protein
MVSEWCGMNGITKIESEVPFGRALCDRLYLNDLHLEKLVNHDKIEAHYLAWETVRRKTNPFFLKGTGFEGYLIGRCPTPEAALEAILTINQHILDAIARFYHFEYGLRSKLMKTLCRDTSDPAAIYVWSTYLGAELGKLRAQIVNNKEAQTFQKQTYRLVDELPPMVYHEIAHSVIQSYAVGSNSNEKYKLDIAAHMLNPSQQDAWLVAENIGEFGHPLVRKFLTRV